jgi:hypothetical protein
MSSLVAGGLGDLGHIKPGVSELLLVVAPVGVLLVGAVGHLVMVLLHSTVALRVSVHGWRRGAGRALVCAGSGGALRNAAAAGRPAPRHAAHHGEDLLLLLPQKLGRRLARVVHGPHQRLPTRHDVEHSLGRHLRRDLRSRHSLAKIPNLPKKTLSKALKTSPNRNPQNQISQNFKPTRKPTKLKTLKTSPQENPQN